MAAMNPSKRTFFLPPKGGWYREALANRDGFGRSPMLDRLADIKASCDYVLLPDGRVIRIRAPTP